MTSFENIGLCIEFKEMVEARSLETGKPIDKCEQYLWKANSIGTSGYGFTKDSTDARRVLLVWRDMNDKNRRIIQSWLRKKNHCKHEGMHCDCGDPHKYYSKEPLRRMIEKDAKAEEFYLGYKFDNDRSLPRQPIDYVSKYTRAASCLNMLVKAEQNTIAIKKITGTITDFYDKVLEIIADEDIDLPTRYRTLRRKIDEYKKEGYECLISGKFNSKNAAKIGKTEDGFDAQVEAQIEALIRKAASKHNAFDAAQITRELNKVLASKGWPELCKATVRLRMKKFDHLIKAGRAGKRKHNNSVAMHVEREAPKAPLLYWTLDGWTAELVYQGPDASGKWSYDNRLVVVVVLDACCKYPIGYAIGDRENSALIKQAMRNALQHTAQLFGNNYRPYQVQSDNYAIKTLTPFYEACTHLFTPAAIGNAKSKIVEPYFNYLNKHYCQLEENWSGFNLSSTNKNQPNIEYLDKIKKTFPGKEQVIQQIVKTIEKERRLKLPAYMAAFNNLPQDDCFIHTKENHLIAFGVPCADTIRIHAAGLQPQINGTQYSYTTFDASFTAYRDVAWRIIYDEQDMSDVLAVNEDGSLRFLLSQKKRIAMDIYSSTDEHHAYRSQISQYNRNLTRTIMDQYEKDAVLVEEVLTGMPLQLDTDDANRVKLMFTHNGQQKERLQDAKGLHAAAKKNAEKEQQASLSDFEVKRLAYNSTKTDLNAFLD